VIRYPVPSTRFPDAVALIDDEDFALVNDGRGIWRAQQVSARAIYAQRYDPDGDGGVQRLHRVIMVVADPKIEVDHRNGDGLDCRKVNMRLAPNRLNARNGHGKYGRALPKGVYPKGLRFHAQIRVAGESIHLGSFATPDAAAAAYDKAAIQHFGEFARTNKEMCRCLIIT
jgi:hypothetical protein